MDPTVLSAVSVDPSGLLAVFVVGLAAPVVVVLLVHALTASAGLHAGVRARARTALKRSVRG